MNRKQVLLWIALAGSMTLPGVALAQGGVVSCRPVGHERSYPCRLGNDVVRTEREHRFFQRINERAGQRRDERWRRDDRRDDRVRDHGRHSNRASHERPRGDNRHGDRWPRQGGQENRRERGISDREYLNWLFDRR